jgi:hypothetical protein
VAIHFPLAMSVIKRAATRSSFAPCYPAEVHVQLRGFPNWYFPCWRTWTIIYPPTNSMFRDIGRWFRQSLRPLLTPCAPRAPRRSCDCPSLFVTRVSIYPFHSKQHSFRAAGLPTSMATLFGALFLVPVNTIAGIMAGVRLIIKRRWRLPFAFIHSQ